MKKVLVFILAVIYITVSSGMVLNIHYCMGKIATAQTGTSSKDCGCKQKGTKDCCKTEHRLLKIQDNQKISYADYSFNTPLKYLAVSHHPVSIQPLVDFNRDDLPNNIQSSPPYYGQDLCIRNCVFRI